MSTPESTTPTKPAKSVTACNNCRHRKLRCDGNSPLCSNCQLHETVCEYAKGRNKSGPPKGVKRKRPATSQEDSGPFASNRTKLDKHDEATKILNKPLTISSPSTVSAKSPPGLPSHADSQGWSDLIPTYIGPIDPNWLAALSLPSMEPLFSSQFPGDCKDPSLSYSSVVNDSTLDHIHLTPLLSTSITAVAPSSCCSPPLPPQDLSNFSGFFDMSNNLTSFLTPPPSDITHNLQEELPHQHNSCYLKTVRSAHPFAPLFPLPQLLQLLLDCATGKKNSVAASFCSSAFSALSSITTPEPMLSTLSERSSHYTSAQKQAMPAYLGVISGSTVHDDDAVSIAAGLIYLAVREVFVFGWGKEASTWLWLAADIVHMFPRTNTVQIGVQRWFARVVWLWNKAFDGCGVTGAESRLFACFGEAEMESIKDESPLAILELDEDQRTFSGLVSLCLDLERMMAEWNMQLAQQGQTQPFSDFINFVPVLQRVRQWLISTPAAHDSLLQFDYEEDGDSTREIVSRVLHLIYYGLSIKLLSSDRTRCNIKKTSLYVAVTHIIDTADWLTRSKRTWLWPFAEPALLLSRDFLLEHSTPQCQISRGDSPSSDTTCPCPPGMDPTLRTGERTLLSLICDVFADSAPAFQLGSSRTLVAAHGHRGLYRYHNQMSPSLKVPFSEEHDSFWQMHVCNNLYTPDI